MNDPPQAAESLVSLIDRLADPAPPPPVPLTPQTAGWVVLAALLVLALVALVVWQVRRYRANAYRRAALAELTAAGDNPAAIALVVRRTALAAWPRGDVASLAGEDWLRFLDTSGGCEDFRRGAGRALVEAPFRGGRPPAGLAEVAARWVRRHRVSRPAP